MKNIIKLLVSGLLVFVLAIGFQTNKVLANSVFRDVPTSHLYVNEIEYLVSKNILSGYDNGTFEPNKYVTRSQASKIIWNAVDYLSLDFPDDSKREKMKFKDVREDDWHKEYIVNMYVNKIIDGYADGTFKPYDNVTNAQIAKIISETFGMKKQVASSAPFSDVTKKDWFEPYVNDLYATGVLTKTPSNKFNPYAQATRSQIAVYVARAMKWHENDRKPISTSVSATAVDHKYPNSYNMILSALSTNESIGYFDKSEMSYLDVRNLIQELINTDPNRFFVDTWVTYDSGKVHLHYVEEKEVIEKRKKETEQKVDSILKKIIKPNYSDYDKVKAVHDYIVLNTAYDYENFKKDTVPEESYMAYGSLVKGVAVCDGYVRAASLLLDRLGIENIYVTGYVAGDGLHSWNMVKLDGKYYHMDTTWDDPVPNKPGYVGYNYFLVSSKQLAKDHTWDQSKYPVANSTYSKK